VGQSTIQNKRISKAIQPASDHIVHNIEFAMAPKFLKENNKNMNRFDKQKWKNKNCKLYWHQRHQWKMNKPTEEKNKCSEDQDNLHA